MKRSGITHSNVECGIWRIPKPEGSKFSRRFAKNRVSSEAYGSPNASLSCHVDGAYGIGKYMANRLNMKGMERIEKTKLARIN